MNTRDKAKVTGMFASLADNIKSGLSILVSLLAFSLGGMQAQEVVPLRTEIPFGLRMAFFKGIGDSTSCLVTLGVENSNLTFFRKKDHFEAHYEVYLLLRETETSFMVKGEWDKTLPVKSYDETSLAANFKPLEEVFSLPPGRYQGFVELKDINAHIYGEGRINVKVPNFTKELPKLSTPIFCDSLVLDDNFFLPPVGKDGRYSSVNLKFPSGKSIFLLVEVYLDSTTPKEELSLVAEAVKPLMNFPQIRESISPALARQRKLIRIPTQTMGLGDYEVEVTLRNAHNLVLARATSFEFSIIRSAEWVETNYQDELRYLKYIATDKEMKELTQVEESKRGAALKAFWDDLDPVPATAVNELKIQYFERIEYANKHFTTESKEGWETDMGEVYILLGPPTEIYGSSLNQIWVYEREYLVLYFFGHNLRNRGVFDEYLRENRWRGEHKQ